ncbi:hypothetical protein VTI28DRAFT_5591 [Corynascus sepedonium]
MTGHAQLSYHRTNSQTTCQGPSVGEHDLSHARRGTSVGRSVSGAGKGYSIFQGLAAHFIYLDLSRPELHHQTKATFPQQPLPEQSTTKQLNPTFAHPLQFTKNWAKRPHISLDCINKKRQRPTRRPVSQVHVQRNASGAHLSANSVHTSGLI